MPGLDSCDSVLVCMRHLAGSLGAQWALAGVTARLQSCHHLNIVCATCTSIMAMPATCILTCTVPILILSRPAQRCRPTLDYSIKMFLYDAGNPHGGDGTGVAHPS